MTGGDERLALVDAKFRCEVQLAQARHALETIGGLRKHAAKAARQAVIDLEVMAVDARLGRRGYRLYAVRPDGILIDPWAHSGSDEEDNTFHVFDRLSPEQQDALGVEVIEGQHPGSSYIGAELVGSVDDANDAARRLNLPIRFFSRDSETSS